MGNGSQPTRGTSTRAAGRDPRLCCRESPRGASQAVGKPRGDGAPKGEAGDHRGHHEGKGVGGGTHQQHERPRPGHLVGQGPEPREQGHHEHETRDRSCATPRWVLRSRVLSAFGAGRRHRRSEYDERGGDVGGRRHEPRASHAKGGQEDERRDDRAQDGAHRVRGVERAARRPDARQRWPGQGDQHGQGCAHGRGGDGQEGEGQTGASQTEGEGRRAVGVEGREPGGRPCECHGKQERRGRDQALEGGVRAREAPGA